MLSEEVRVQPFMAGRAVEVFDVGVLDWLTRLDKQEPDVQGGRRIVPDPCP